MEDIDDDFGELYADFDVQPCTPNPCISELHTEKTEVNKEAVQSKLQSGADDAAAAAKVLSADADFDTGSDSEDDLKILLNDDDVHSPNFPVITCGGNLRGGGYEDEDDENHGGFDKNLNPIDQSQVQCGYNSQYKYVRPNGEAISSSKGNGSAGIGFYSSVSGRTEQGDNGCNQHRSSSLLAQRKSSFSLPRFKTILDVNIDGFGYKPWKNPEADITDYFNFGFDEVSWKHYCNKLNQCRHGESTSSKILASESRKTNKTCETALEERKGVCLFTSSCGQNAKAIQVEDSILDRQPSIDVMPPVYRDSDVIQINLQESNGESSGSLKGISALVDCSEFELSEDSEHDSGEIRCFDSAKRPAKPPKERKAVRTNSDDHERVYMPGDGYDQEVEFNASNGTIEANTEIPNHKTKHFARMSRKNPSEAELTQHSPSSSISDHLKRASWDSVASDYHSIVSRDCNVKTRENGYNFYDERRRGHVYINKRNMGVSGGPVPKSKTHLCADDRYPLYDAERFSDKNRRESDLDDHYSLHDAERFSGKNRRESDVDDFYRMKDSYYRSPQGKSHEEFGVGNHEYYGSNLDEEEFYFDERTSRLDDELMERDWCRYDCRLNDDDVDPILYKEHSFRRRIDANEFSPEEHFPGDIRWDRYDKPVPYGEYDEKLPLTRRIPGRFECRNRSPSVVFDDFRSMDQEDELWRFSDRHAEEYNSPRNGLHERHMKFKRDVWAERPRESDADVNIDNYENDVVHQRHYWKSEVLHWKEAASFPLQRIMKPKKFDAKKHHNETGQVEWRMPNLMNQGIRGNRFGKKSNSMMCNGKYDQSVRRSNNSCQVSKTLGKFNARGGICNNVKPERFIWNINVEKKTSNESKVAKSTTTKMEQPNKKTVPAKKRKQNLDTDEGQTIGKEKGTRNHNIPPCNQVKKGNKILEVIAKMEKRRERFEKPIDPDPKPTTEKTSEPVGMKEKRPARKRRWGGN